MKSVDSDSDFGALATHILADWPYIVLPAITIAMLAKIGLKISDKLDIKKQKGKIVDMLAQVKQKIKTHDVNSADDKADKLFDVFYASFRIYKVATSFNQDLLGQNLEYFRNEYLLMLNDLYPSDKKMGELLTCDLNLSYAQENEIIEIESNSKFIIKNYGYLINLWDIFLSKISPVSAIEIFLFDVIPYITTEVVLLSHLFHVTEKHLKRATEDDLIFIFDSLIDALEENKREFNLEMTIEVLGLIHLKSDHLFNQILEEALNGSNLGITTALLSKYLLIHYSKDIDHCFAGLQIKQKLIFNLDPYFSTNNQ